MRVLFIVRSTLFTTKGGDTVQVLETAAALRRIGVEVDIEKSSAKPDYTAYDGLHFFNITRPADMLSHIKYSRKPFVVSVILINYAVFDKYHRLGVAGKLFRSFSPTGIEYAKTMYRILSGRDDLASSSYVWKGQKRSIQEILKQTKAVLVQAKEEYADLVQQYGIQPPFHLIYNAVNTDIFKQSSLTPRDPWLVLCVARIEGLKNQLNLIKALNHTKFKLLLVGDAAPGQQAYYQSCKDIAASNVSFISHLPQQELIQYYAMANVHVLPSWFEVCGLTSMEAAAMGCRVVITRNGYAHSYFGEAACYCDPACVASIKKAVESAAANSAENMLPEKIINNYSWKQTADATLSVYKKFFY